MLFIQEVIVVEGKSDTGAISQAVQADTIETGGSAINREILDKIALAQQRRGVIIFTDPDHAGERIRKIISQQVPGCKHAFISQEKASHQGRIGIEYASKADILEALQHLKTEGTPHIAEITQQDLIDSGLILHSLSASRRLAMGKILGIGYCNGKQFLKRCHIFRITHQEFHNALQQIQKKGLFDEKHT